MSSSEQYTTVLRRTDWGEFYKDADRTKLEALGKLVREAVGLFNDGLNIGLGWVARAERVLGEDE